MSVGLVKKTCAQNAIWSYRASVDSRSKSRCSYRTIFHNNRARLILYEILFFIVSKASGKIVYPNSELIIKCDEPLIMLACISVNSNLLIFKGSFIDIWRRVLLNDSDCISYQFISPHHSPYQLTSAHHI